jgi:hypothetical protein
VDLDLENGEDEPGRSQLRQPVLDSSCFLHKQQVCKKPAATPWLVDELGSCIISEAEAASRGQADEQGNINVLNQSCILCPDRQARLPQLRPGAGQSKASWYGFYGGVAGLETVTHSAERKSEVFCANLASDWWVREQDVSLLLASLREVGTI